MGVDQGDPSEIMYYSGDNEPYSKHKCPHDARANTSVWVVLNERGWFSPKDPTLAINCEGSLYTDFTMYMKIITSVSSNLGL